MTDGFVNLQSKLRTIENDVGRALRTLLGTMQSNRFFCDPAGILKKSQLLNHLIALVLQLPAKGIRIRAFLDFISRERVRGIACARGIFRLMDVTSLG